MGEKESRMSNKGPDLKSTINFKQRCSPSLSPHRYFSRRQITVEKSNFHKALYSFINNSALKYNLQISQKFLFSLKHILKATTTKRSEAIVNSLTD